VEVALPRKKIQDRPRYPSGKLKPEFAAPTIVRRILNEALRSAANPLLGSTLGRFRLVDKIDNDQLSAGMRFAEIVANWHRVQGLPPPFPKGATLQIGLGKSLSGDTPEHVIDAAGKAYKTAMKALEGGGRSAQRAVVSVAILDRSTLDLVSLRAGLDLLKAHFHLTKSYR
jgi:hypothetical protein